MRRHMLLLAFLSLPACSGEAPTPTDESEAVEPSAPVSTAAEPRASDSPNQARKVTADRATPMAVEIETPTTGRFDMPLSAASTKLSSSHEALETSEQKVPHATGERKAGFSPALAKELEAVRAIMEASQ
jgi:hypothetical protein